MCCGSSNDQITRKFAVFNCWTERWSSGDEITRWFLMSLASETFAKSWWKCSKEQISIRKKFDGFKFNSRLLKNCHKLSYVLLPKLSKHSMNQLFSGKCSTQMTIPQKATKATQSLNRFQLRICITETSKPATSILKILITNSFKNLFIWTWNEAHEQEEGKENKLSH